MNDPKVFKLGIGNDLEISYGLGVEKITGSVCAFFILMTITPVLMHI